MAPEVSPERVAAPAQAVVECRGDYRAMGRDQGAACRAELSRIEEVLLSIALPHGGRLAGALGRVMPPVTGALGRAGRRLMTPDLVRLYPEHLERMIGIAEGAAVPVHRLFMGPMVELVLNRAAYTMPPPAACTAIAVTRGRSASGEAIIAKNFDYPPASSAVHLTRWSRPRSPGRAASLEVTKAPLTGCHDGVNEHGLAVAYNYGHFRGRARARISISVLVQELLETCRSVGDAIAWLRDRPRSGGALLMLADAEGDIASVELAPDFLTVRRGEALVHANHALTEDMAERDVPREALFPRWIWPAELRGRRLLESSERRHARASSLVGERGAASEEDLVAMLSDHGAAARGDDHTVCRHGPYYSTTSSVVIFPRRRAMRVLVGSPCTGSFTDLSL
ncbi:MAG TPA: C45 family peptidase [Candidatus Acidoferrum sp.]|nr:C45 family peptidase [Candidatus Acidoferrum sp.]